MDEYKCLNCGYSFMRCGSSVNVCKACQKWFYSGTFEAYKRRFASQDNPQPSKGGVKADEGKAPWHLLPYDALAECVDVLRQGAEKYAPRNWEQGMMYSRLFSAAMRHMTAWWQHDETCSEDMKRHHLAHAAIDLLFLLSYELRGMQVWDDRPFVEKDDDA